MAVIYNDGTDQYVLIQAISTSGGLITGDNEGFPLPGAILIFSEYKGSDTIIDTPVVEWNSTIGLWKATIPATQSGSRVISKDGEANLVISGTDMVTSILDITVTSVTPTVWKNIVTLLIGNTSGTLDGAGTIIYTKTGFGTDRWAIASSGTRTHTSFTEE